MKLLFCPDRKEVVPLTQTRHGHNDDRCSCGKTAGFYSDLVTAVHNGHGVPFMIHNYQFLEAVERHQENPSLQEEHRFYASVLPRECETLVVKPEWKKQSH